MSNNSEFNTFLFLSNKIINISVFSENDFKKIYEKEKTIQTQSNHINYEELDYFLHDNIFRIEKKLDNFIKKIQVIIDIDDFFIVKLSINKKGNENPINLKNLRYLVHEAKEDCKKTFGKRKIVHLIIKNYKVDNQNFSSLPKNMDHKIFSIDLEFISLSNEIIENLEKILNKYQISLERIVNSNYVREFLIDVENENIFSMTKKILSGHNLNEVFIVNKSTKNLGLFEKFFNILN